MIPGFFMSCPAYVPEDECVESPYAVKDDFILYFPNVDYDPSDGSHNWDDYNYSDYGSGWDNYGDYGDYGDNFGTEWSYTCNYGELRCKGFN